jgi:hypothetical protein
VGGIELPTRRAARQVRVHAAPSTATPKTRPTCRSALTTADAIAAWEAATADIAIVVVAVPDSPMPRPRSATFHQIAPMPVSVPSRSSPSVAAPLTTSPAAIGRGASAQRAFTHKLRDVLDDNN